LRLGGTTWRWLCEALTASSAIQSLGRYSPVPTLIMQAGEDRLVNTGAQDRYCADAPRCQLTRFPSSKHEVFHERDDIRNEAVSQVIKFLNERVKP
jgi:lysophospholipase